MKSCKDFGKIYQADIDPYVVYIVINVITVDIVMVVYSSLSLELALC